MSYIFQWHLKNLLHTFGKVPARELKRKGGGKIGRQIEKRVADWQLPPVRHSSDASISSHTTAETGALFPLDPSFLLEPSAALRRSTALPPAHPTPRWRPWRT